MHHGRVDGKSSGSGGNRRNHVLGAEAIEIPAYAVPINAISHDTEVLGQLKIQAAHAAGSDAGMSLKRGGSAWYSSDFCRGDQPATFNMESTAAHLGVPCHLGHNVRE